MEKTRQGPKRLTKSNQLRDLHLIRVSKVQWIILS